MADTAPKIPEEEHQESPDAVDRKAADLADRIRRSKHFIVFTGAGVSTSAGLYFVLVDSHPATMT